MSCTEDALMEAFRADAVDRMRALAAARVILETAPADPASWDEVRRVAHTIAGNAAMMGFERLARAARGMERRAVAVAERGGVHEDVWSLDGERETLERLLRAAGQDGPAAGEAA